MNINGLGGQYANQVIPVQGSIVFGRNSASCDVLFSDETKGISRMHCRIDVNNGNYTITDLGSSYGTFVNGLKLQPYAPKVLSQGDTFYLGDKRNMFSISGASGAMADTSLSFIKDGSDKSILIAVIVVFAVLFLGLIISMSASAASSSPRYTYVPAPQSDYYDSRDSSDTDSITPGSVVGDIVEEAVDQAIDDLFN